MAMLSLAVRFGSSADYAVAKRHFRFTPEADMRGAARDVRFGPIADMAQLFDHLVGNGEQRLRNCQTERLCGLEIDNELILGRRLHRHVGWLLALEDAIDIARGTPARIM